MDLSVLILVTNEALCAQWELPCCISVHIEVPLPWVVIKIGSLVEHELRMIQNSSDGELISLRIIKSTYTFEILRHIICLLSLVVLELVGKNQVFLELVSIPVYLLFTDLHLFLIHSRLSLILSTQWLAFGLFCKTFESHEVLEPSIDVYWLSLGFIVRRVLVKHFGFVRDLLNSLKGYII